MNLSPNNPREANNVSEEVCSDEEETTPSKSSTECYQRDTNSTSGSCALDSLLGGGLFRSSVTDVFGAAATGKTQFAFQNAALTCSSYLYSDHKLGPEAASRPVVVFVDCAGSFRPERIAEMASSRGYNAAGILELISSIAVRTVSEQRRASEAVLNDDKFSRCRLLIVDDVTNNFIAQLNEPEQLIERQFLLSNYLRRLSYISLRRGFSTLLTNSVRSRAELGVDETAGRLLSQFAYYRLRFGRDGRTRYAVVEQPLEARKRTTFEIETAGIP